MWARKLNLRLFSVAEPDAIVEVVNAEQGLELPAGQVPQGLINGPGSAGSG